MQGSTTAGQFVFEQRAAEPVPSVLYDEHVKRTGKSHIAAFAGYLMPLWYSSIAEEHRAVRERAGLFDCTHMGVLEVEGDDAGSFLEIVSTNKVRDMKIGRARYGYILDAAGNVLDDIIIYRRGETNFMVVVNASNEPKIRFYLHELQEGRAARRYRAFRVGGQVERPAGTGLGYAGPEPAPGSAGGPCPAGTGLLRHPGETGGCPGFGADRRTEELRVRRRSVWRESTV